MSELSTPSESAKTKLVVDLFDRTATEANSSIAHPELGAVNGFPTLEPARRELLTYALELCKRLSSGTQLFDFIGLSNEVRRVDTALEALTLIRSEIDANISVNGGVNQPQYPRWRQQFIPSALERVIELHAGLSALDTSLSAREARHAINVHDVAAQRAQLVNTAAEADRVLAEVKHILEGARTAALDAAVKSSSTSFDALARTHKHYQWTWFSVFVAGVVATIVQVAIVASSLKEDAAMPPQNSAQMIERILGHLLVVTLVAVLAKLCLAKYNVERNLRIIYSHRVAVLAQFQTFEDATGETDLESKNRFRLEIAKYIFSDPQTGYSAPGQSEFNISPIIQLAERLPGKLP